MRAWLEQHGFRPAGPPETIRERPWSAIVRIPTADGAVYLKRCGPISAYEVPLVAALAERWPDRMPTVLAADVERAWLLMADGGTTLRFAGRERFAEAVALYAELQVAEAARAGELMELGLPHLPLGRVAGACATWLDAGHAARARELCSALDAYGLPESIQHDDLHDNNVFLRDGRLALYDWGDATVAHPLFSFVKPFDVAMRDRGDPEPLRAAFLRPWTAHLPERELRAALAIAMPLGRVAYVTQLQRHLDLMPSADRAPLEEHRELYLRTARAELDALV